MSKRKSLASRIKKGVKDFFFDDDELPDCFGTHTEYANNCEDCPIEEDCQDELVRRLEGKEI